MFSSDRADHDPSPQLTVDGLISFLRTLTYRESFLIDIVSTYPRLGWNGQGNVVWVEATFRPDQKAFQFFFDDGVLPEFDEGREAIGDTNDYPSILCSLSDIVAVRRI